MRPTLLSIDLRRPCQAKERIAPVILRQFDLADVIKLEPWGSLHGSHGDLRSERFAGPDFATINLRLDPSGLFVTTPNPYPLTFSPTCDGRREHAFGSRDLGFSECWLLFGQSVGCGADNFGDGHSGMNVAGSISN